MLATMPTGSSLPDLCDVVFARPSMVPLVSPVKAIKNLLPDQPVVFSDPGLGSVGAHSKGSNPPCVCFDLLGRGFFIIDFVVM